MTIDITFRMYDVTSWNEDFLNGAVSVYIVERPAFLKGALIFNDYISNDD